MVAVVHFLGDKRLEFVEHAALYPFLFKHAVVLYGKREQAADIVINHAHVHALLCLFFEDFKD